MRKGFTLIELAVVITIIAVSFMFISPIMNASERGNRYAEPRQTTMCLSNVKQLAMATLSYAQDYDEVLPTGGGVLGEYTKNSEQFECPATSVLPSYALGGNRAGHGLNQDDPGSKPMLWEITSTTEPALDRHRLCGNDGSNIAFLDGHACWVGRTIGQHRYNIPPAEQLASGTTMIPLTP